MSGRKRAYRSLLPSFTGRHGPGRLELLDPPPMTPLVAPELARPREGEARAVERCGRSPCWAFVGVFLRSWLAAAEQRDDSVRIAMRGIAMCWSF